MIGWHNRKEIVEKMINALNGRGGFDEIWSYR